MIRLHLPCSLLTDIFCPQRVNKSCQAYQGFIQPDSLFGNIGEYVAFPISCFPVLKVCSIKYLLLSVSLNVSVYLCLSVCLSLRWCVHKHDELAFMIKSYKYNRPKEEMTLECNTKLFKAAKVRLKHILHVYCYIYDTFINISHALTKGGFVDLLLIYLLYIASYQKIIKPYYPDFNNKLNPEEGSLKGALRLASS